MSSYQFELPAYFADDAFEIEAKGYFGPLLIRSGARTYSVSFYDEARLRQETSDALAAGPCFAEPNLVVLKSVTKELIEAAIEHLASKSFRDLGADISQ